MVADVYDSYLLCCISPELIRKIRELNVVLVLGSRANADEYERSLRVIDSTNFKTLPDRWSRRGDGRSLAPVRRCVSAD